MNSFYGLCLEQLITKRARMNVLVARGNCFCCCYFVVVVVVIVVFFRVGANLEQTGNSDFFQKT